MKFPKLILFDYGHTVGIEDFDGLRGTRALMPYITENPHGYTAEEIQEKADLLNRHVGRFDPARKIEIGHLPFQRLLYGSLGIRFCIGEEAVQRIFWDAAGPAKLTPGFDLLLEELRALGIASGIISNIGYTGDALAERIAKLCGGHPFRCVISSADWLVKKPDPLLFTAAMEQCGVSREEGVWYCGDSFEADVCGAEATGIEPVWYRPEGENDPDKNCLQIACWQELISLLHRLKG